MSEDITIIAGVAVVIAEIVITAEVVVANEDMTIIVEAAAVVAAAIINDLQWVEVNTTNGEAEAAVNRPLCVC